MNSKAALATLLCCASLSALASPLEDVASLVTDQLGQDADNVRVDMPQADLDELLKGCEVPTPTLIGTAPQRGGRITVTFSCGGRLDSTRPIIANVTVSGMYLVAARAIPAGSELQSDDLEWRTGDLSKLPRNLVESLEDAEGKTTIRPIPKGATLQPSTLKTQPVVTRNAEVRVVVAGTGFHIEGRGVALENAGLNEWAKIKMPGGEVLRAQATGLNEVLVTQ
ncbi:flagellar basal body P-ring formation chaperone FlgA [Pseudomonas nitroreducens]|uniref:flagellar basal body P-ring formation chaperone FlgA n=1 Tax=Pseudomonas nitroreducens TaxID=46680 RepID=UPI001C889027|nr:flagellar basal body P-ring formation chaperone FlgA [Pseudomonas nitritireducens]